METKGVKTAFLALVLTFLSLVFLEKSAFYFYILPSNQVRAGQAIFLMNPVPEYTYSVFWVNAYNPSDESACAFISGADLVNDNDLTHNGTCFVNDPGSFKVVELSDEFFASFTDSKQSYAYVSFVSFPVKGYFPIPGAPVLISSQNNNGTITIQKPTFTTSCAADYTITLYSDDQQIASGVCPISGTIALTSTVALSYDLHYFTARASDSTGAMSIPSDPTYISVLKRRVLSFQ